MPHGFGRFAHLDDDQWIETLVRSVDQRVIDGVEFPGFPDPELQAMIVGSSNQHALREAGNFYRHVKRHYAALAAQPISNATILDFGIGWGRIARFFARDVPLGQVHGVDVLPQMIDICRRTMAPATCSLVTPSGLTLYRDGIFDLVYAYSVFTHLPEPIFAHWLGELHRIMRPGAMLAMTVEPPRFIEFCRSIADGPALTVWHRLLRNAIAGIPDAEERAAAGRLVYIPTGGDRPELPPDVYGDTVVPPGCIETHWGHLFEVIDYLDDPSRFWQAVVILKRR